MDDFLYAYLKGKDYFDMAKLNKNGDFNSINKDIMPLDSRIKYENDNIESSSCHSGLRAGIQRDDNLMPKAFRFDQSGRSMVEMLGTLAIIGVLSIGGIMGYSYAVDKYHANQIMNDVNLRGIDLIAQASRGGDFSLAEWPTKTSGDLDIGLEVDEATNTTEGGIYVKDVEKHICEIIADDLLPEEVELVIDGEAYVSGACGETNKMVFYYDAIGEALGGGNQTCVETENGCVSCPAGATISADKTTCECSDGKTWNATTNECVQLSCKEAMIEAGFDEAIFTVDGNTIVITGEATGNMELTSPIDANHCDLKLEADPGSTIRLPSMKVKSFTCRTEGLSIMGYGQEQTILSISSGQINLESECRYLTIGDLSMSSVSMTVQEGTVITTTNLNDVNIVSTTPNDTLTIRYSTIENSIIEGNYVVSENNSLLNTTVDCDEFYSSGNTISGATITADNIRFEQDTIINTLTATASEKIELNSASIEVEDDGANITFATKQIDVSDSWVTGDREKINIVVPSDDPCNIIKNGECVGPNNPFAS